MPCKTVPYAGPAASIPTRRPECHIDGEFLPFDGETMPQKRGISCIRLECALEQCAARCLSGSMVSERDWLAAAVETDECCTIRTCASSGMGARGIAIAFQRAIDGIDGADGIAGIGGNDVTESGTDATTCAFGGATSRMETAETAEIAEEHLENAGPGGKRRKRWNRWNRRNRRNRRELGAVRRDAGTH